MTLFILFVLAVALLVIGAEMFLVMGVPAILAKFLYFSEQPNLILGQKIVGGIEIVTLMAIPFFIFAADIMARGRMASDLANLFRVLVGNIRGGAGYSTVVANMAFGAAAGSAPATVAAMGRVSYAQLKESGYRDRFSLALIASSAECALLIPPSIAFVVYSWLTGTSIAKLFAAGAGVGILLGFAFMVLVLIETIRQKISAGARYQWSGIGELARSGWVIGLQFIVLGGIFGGFFTATEAAAISALYASFVEVVILRSINIREYFSIAKTSAVSTGVVFILLSMGALLAYFITLSGVDAWLISQVKESGISAFQFLMIINILFLIAGMFLDPNSIMLIFLPTLFPIATTLGIDPVHFGVVVVLNVCIGMITPPFGLDLFVTAGTLKRPVEDVIAGIFPFIVVNLVVLAAITYLPELSLWIPRAMGM